MSLKNKHHFYYTGFGRNEVKPAKMKPLKGKYFQIHFFCTKQESNLHFLKIQISALNVNQAQRCLDLIQSSHTLIQNYPLEFVDNLIAVNELEPKWMREEERQDRLLSRYYTSFTFLACNIAAKSSFRLKISNAITRHNISVQLVHVHHSDLNPYDGCDMMPNSQSENPEIYLRNAFSISACYSAIEELNLGINLKGEKSSYDPKSGTWNPRVREDLEMRLTKAGVNIDQSFVWTLRGGKKKTELKMKQIPMIAKTEWNKRNVRDVNINICDAIRYASWLRSRLSSHATSTEEGTTKLSIYDVFNVQNLSRRLILESLGFLPLNNSETDTR